MSIVRTEKEVQVRSIINPLNNTLYNTVKFGNVNFVVGKRLCYY